MKLVIPVMIFALLVVSSDPATARDSNLEWVRDTPPDLDDEMYGSIWRPLRTASPTPESRSIVSRTATIPERS